MTEAKIASSLQHKPDSNVSNNVERHFKNCAILRSDNDNSKIAFTKLMKIVKNKFRLNFKLETNLLVKIRVFSAVILETITPNASTHRRLSKNTRKT